MPPLPEPLDRLSILVGGMGVDISSVGLVSAAANDPSGEVSGSLSATGLADIYARLLQLGDPGGEVRSAFAAFQAAVPALARETEAIFTHYHVPGGKKPEALFRGPSLRGLTPPREVQILTAAATFSHVWRTKRLAPGRPIGINFLRKIERVLLYGLYGAMLAEADWIVMGAGDTSLIPSILDRLSRHEAVELPVQVATVPLGAHKIRFDPKELAGGAPPPKRPVFIAIVSSHLQAEGLCAAAAARPDALVIEGHKAGGHNAPPKNKAKDEHGHYVYGPEDDANLSAVEKLGIPFWVAGGCGLPASKDPRRKTPARRQVGTLFALCEESGLAAAIRSRALRLIWQRKLDVYTSPGASPSTYPFKVAAVPGTIGDPAVYARRPRKCNMGYLRGYRPKEGEIIGLCPAANPEAYKNAGGAAWRAQGAMCLCNGLIAACGLGQPEEAGLVTLGDIAPVRDIQQRLHRMEYTVKEALSYLRGTL